MTLNMLNQSRINPKLSAHDQFFGTFNYNRTPLAPLGTKVIIHEKPTQRASWDPHGKEGWLTGPALHHYRHFEVAVAATGGQRVSNTIKFLPTKYNMPKMSSEDRITAAIEELSSAIKHPQRQTPFLNGDATNNIIHELTEIFQTDTAPPTVLVEMVTPMELQGCQQKQSPHMDLQGCLFENYLFLTNWDIPSTSHSATANGSTKAKLSNTMPVKNYTNSSMKMGIQKNCPMKKYKNKNKIPINTSATRFERVGHD